MEQLPKQCAPDESAHVRSADGPEQVHAPHGPGKKTHGHGHGHEERRFGARLTVYYFICIICNFLLAIYGLYAIGLCADLSQQTLAANQNASLAETVYQLVLLASPILLTILLNRLLFCAMRGRRHRFPRWAAPVACLLILLVQAGTILLIFSLFGTQAAPGFGVDTVTSLLP